MTADCKELRRRWGWGDASDPEDAGHLAGCGACRRVAAGFERLDGLLASERAPLAPPELAPAVLGAVADRRRREVSRARRQTLALLAAAALVATLGAQVWNVSATSLEWSAPAAEAWRPDLTPYTTYVADPGRLWDGLGASLQGALEAVPEPPLLVLLLVLPALVALNWSVCRGRAAPAPGGIA